MKFDINETALVPYIIAEKVIWDMLGKEERYKYLQPSELNEIVRKIEPILTGKAEILYNSSEHFRNAINDKRKDMRLQLQMFMEHWIKAILKNKNSKIKLKTIKILYSCN